MPECLDRLLKRYACEAQGELRYNPAIWKERLDPTCGPDFVVNALEDDRYSRADALGRRYTCRARVVNAIDASLDAQDDEAVRRAFLLMYAWGNGSLRHGFGHAAKALADASLATRLRTVALSVRGANREPMRDVLETTMVELLKIDGIGQTFASKWLAFSGKREGRDWQPLIIDSRVKATLSGTLDLSLSTFGPVNASATWYAGYVEALHGWAKEPRVSAERLEWILFRHDGGPVPDP